MMGNNDAPYSHTMGFARSIDGQGRLIITMPGGEDKVGRPGYIHGGALAGLLETAAYATLKEALEDTDCPQLKPVSMTVSYMRGALQQPTHARATIERLGRRIANVEAVAWQEDPTKPVAMAQLNVMLDRSKR
jgi:uncharacterized protein (TIGR00369 family)